VVEVAVGTGTNTAALIEAVEGRGLVLRWWGLELDPAPLQLALADPRFQAQWSPATLRRLAELAGSDRMLWGDARARLPELVERLEGRCDLILLDAFSPRRCPELWTLEFLGRLARLLSPSGRLITYSSAAAVRRALLLAGLKLAAIRSEAHGPVAAGARASGSPLPCAPPAAPSHRVEPPAPTPEARPREAGPGRPATHASPPSAPTAATAGPPPGPPPSGGSASWSAGTVASPTDLPTTEVLRPLSRMEREHMASTAGEPYRDPGGTSTAAQILAARARTQAGSGAEASSAWQRRWGMERRRITRSLPRSE
jgi:tRNA U34 5-methylaminomethyl-2-thiouridine-forming methyltransferase MnmC